jgi:hypothetical protein
MLLIPEAIVPDPSLGGPAASVEFAARAATGETSGCEVTVGGPTASHFSYLVRNIERMFLSGAPPYDARRTWLTTGIFDYVLAARTGGVEAVVPSPDLAIAYNSYADDSPPSRPAGPRPSGASLDIGAADDVWSAGGARWQQRSAT